MDKKSEPKKILVILPTLLGIVMLIAGSASGVTGLFYAGMAVLFGGNGLLVLGTIIYVIYTVASLAKEERAKAKAEGGEAPRGCFSSKGCLPAAIIIGLFIGFPLAGVVFMDMENFSIGLPLFFLGPAILVVFAVVSGMKARKNRREYDERLYRNDVKEEKKGAIELCIKLDAPVNDNNYFVRVNCGGEHISAYARNFLEKGTAVKIVTYDNDKVEAVELTDGYFGGEKSRKPTEATEPRDDVATPPAPTAKRGTRSKAKAKANPPSGSASASAAPAAKPLDSTTAQGSDEKKNSYEETESMTITKRTVIVNGKTIESTEETTVGSTHSHTVRTGTTVGYRKIGKK